MTKIIELHLLQSFAPSNLNRDDTGAPKDCTFGGVRRARISSQCLKRSIRLYFAQAGLLSDEELGKRTRLIRDSIAVKLAERSNIELEQARAVAALAVESVGLKIKDKGETQYLVFWGPDEINALVDLCAENWDSLAAVAPKTLEEVETKGRKSKKKNLAKGVDEEIKRLAREVLSIPKAADIALFGRMLADLPAKNIDAACQVAHAVSTHKTEMEVDYFTAVDDLQRIESDEGAGAGMIGSISFNSATFYRYANINYPQLLSNLKGDAELTRRSIEAFIRSSLEALPTGKQNTFAAHNPPSFALVLVREGGVPLSLANAFERPVRHDLRNSGGYILPSLEALDAFWGRTVKAFGIHGAAHYLLLEEQDLPNINASAAAVAGLDELVSQTVSALSNGR